MKLFINKKGSIFIDVMMGIYILGIVALIYGTSIGMSIVSCKKASETTLATSVVNRHLETIKNLGYGNLGYNSLLFYGLIESSPSSSPYSFKNVGSTKDKITDLLTNGAGTVTVTDASTTVRKVVVTVTWTSKGVNKSVTGCAELAKFN